MTNEFDDGGPAYPFHNLEVHGNPGMSLRDAFAMAAIQGMLADRETILSFASKCREKMLSPESAIATAAYGMAEAMIAERNKRRGEG